VKVVVAGNPTLDIIYTATGVYRRYGGPIYYAARALKALGAEVEVIGVASSDDVEKLGKIFAEMGVRPRLFESDSTTTFELDYRVRPRSVKLLKKPSRGIEKVAGDIVILSPVYDELKNAEVYARIVVADLQGYLRSQSPLPRADLVHFSVDDIQLTLKELVHFAERWPRVVYTLGEDGAYVLFDGYVYHINSAKVSTDDTTGSGDVFLAVLTYFHLVKGLDILSAACEASMYVAGFLLTRQIIRHEFNCVKRAVPMTQF